MTAELLSPSQAPQFAGELYSARAMIDTLFQKHAKTNGIPEADVYEYSYGLKSRAGGHGIPPGVYLFCAINNHNFKNFNFKVTEDTVAILETDNTLLADEYLTNLVHSEPMK